MVRGSRPIEVLQSDRLWAEGTKGLPRSCPGQIAHLRALGSELVLMPISFLLNELRLHSPEQFK